MIHVIIELGKEKFCFVHIARKQKLRSYRLVLKNVATGSGKKWTSSVQVCKKRMEE